MHFISQELSHSNWGCVCSDHLREALGLWGCQSTTSQRCCDFCYCRWFSWKSTFLFFLFWGKTAIKYIQWPVISPGKFYLHFCYLWLCCCLWSEVDWFLIEPSGDSAVWKSTCYTPSKLLCGKTMLFYDYNSSGLVLVVLGMDICQ